MKRQENGMGMKAAIVVLVAVVAWMGLKGDPAVEGVPAPTKTTLTGQEIANAMIQAMDARDRKMTEFPIMAPEEEYTDAMMQINAFGEEVNKKIEAMKETDSRIVAAIEKLTEKDLDTIRKAAENDGQIQEAIEGLSRELASMKAGMSARPVDTQPEPKDERVDELADKLSRMEAKLSQPSSIDYRNLIPVATKVEGYNPSWDRPVVVPDGMRLVGTKELGPVASPPASELGLIRSAISATGETVETSTNILSDAAKGVIDVGGGTIKDLTNTAGKTIGGASAVTGTAVTGASGLASDQGKRVWKKIW